MKQRDAALTRIPKVQTVLGKIKTPGVGNMWSMPIKNRLDMLTTDTPNRHRSLRRWRSNRHGWCGNDRLCDHGTLTVTGAVVCVSGTLGGAAR